VNDSEKRLLQRFAAAIDALVCAIGGLAEQNKCQTEWFKSHFALATLSDLKRMEKNIMAEIAVVTSSLKEAVASIKQVNIDIADTQTKITALNVKITELEAAIAAGGTGVPQEVADLAEEVKTLAKQADEALPNPVAAPAPV
jgi:methyl-accepting chemotaxis protein